MSEQATTDQTAAAQGAERRREINVPELALVVLMGPSGSGKSSFAARHFLDTEIVSSDACRALVSDDEGDQSATADAFELLHHTVRLRLKRRKLTVVDATNVRAEDRASLLALAREAHCLAVAIVLDLPPRLCHERNEARPNRRFGAHVTREQSHALRRSLRTLRREGFRYKHVLKSQEAVDAVAITRSKLWCDLTDRQGPFDIIGDVHGCFDELVALLARLGWTVRPREDSATDSVIHRWAIEGPPGRTLVFLGDLVDRGPRTPDVLSLVMGAVAEGKALCVVGNHDAKLARALGGDAVKLTHGLDRSMAQLAGEPEAFREAARAFLGGLISHYMLDGGRLCVAHAGLPEALQGRASGAVRQVAMYGETDGETDSFGLPVRHDWAAAYRGEAVVAYGHTPTVEAEWINDTICLDTGCVFGGKLSAMRWPEREVVTVDAAEVYAEPIRPLDHAQVDAQARSGQQLHDLDLELAEVSGKRIIHTSLLHRVIVRAEQNAAALEVMSRFAADPRWLITLPATMAPTRTAPDGPWLEHPREALAYFRERGVAEVVMEEKHMGSRAVVIVCREDEVAITRFGFAEGAPGVVLTRTGRRFFHDAATERAILQKVREAAEASGLFEALETGWLCLDCELMPWNAKAQSLLVQQYAPVGLAAQLGLSAAEAVFQAAASRGVDVGDQPAVLAERLDRASRLQAAYRPYCWPVERLEDYRLAPFHLLASEGACHAHQPHRWHLEQLGRLAAASDGMIQATAHRFIALDDEAACLDAIAWWEALTRAGGEGVVIKPPSLVTHDARGKLVQPGVKCRGAEYLRLIYGPEYDRPDHLERLRQRGLSRKSNLALQEHALGVEALERFVRREPLRRVHECVFGVLALESEPIDPRL